MAQQDRSGQVRRYKRLRQRLNTGSAYSNMTKDELIAETERLQEEVAQLVRSREDKGPPYPEY
jgi:DNA-binding protein H-NS